MQMIPSNYNSDLTSLLVPLLAYSGFLHQVSAIPQIFTSALTVHCDAVRT